jgi:hypothetical protein
VWPTSGGLPTTPTLASRNYSDQPRLIGQLSEHVFELMLKAPDDQLRDATFDLIDALTPPNEPCPRGGHVLCELFERVAVELQCLLAAPGMVLDKLVGETVGGSEVLSAAVRVLLKYAMQLATAHATAPLNVMHIKACACALAFCPDSGAHPSLEKNCGIPLLTAAASH